MLEPDSLEPFVSREQREEAVRQHHRTQQLLQSSKLGESEREKIKSINQHNEKRLMERGHLWKSRYATEYDLDLGYILYPGFHQEQENHSKSGYGFQDISEANA